MLSPLTSLEERTSSWKVGYPPLPVINGTKRAADKGWQHLSRQNPPPYVNEYPNSDALSTGIYCGDVLIAVDIDVDDAVLAEQVFNVASSYLGLAPMRYRDGSSRRLLVYRNAEPKKRYRSISGGDGLKIDFLAGDRYFVAFGLHPDGTMYAWNTALKDYPVASLTAVSPEQVEAFRTTAAQILRAQIVITAESSPSEFDLASAYAT